MLRQSTGLGHDEVRVVSPQEAKTLLACGTTRLYKLIYNGELESFKDGRSRRITMRSIKARINRLIAAGAGL